jgi:hypothetical protein
LKRSTPPLTLLALAACSAISACAGGNGSDRGPQATVAESLAAQRDFREIYRRWAAGRPTDRGRLEPLLVDFLRRHPGDRRVRMARVYLAWVYVQRGELGAARRLVAETRAGPAGSARDFAAVAEAAILLREGKPNRAESVLSPLDGKLIDPEERFLYGEQRVLAALAAHRDRDVIEYMQSWLVQVAPEDRAAVQGSVHDMVQGLGSKPLERALPSLSEQVEGGGNPEVAQARHWMLDAVSNRLIRIALEKKDGELARRLLDSKIPTFRRGDKGAALARIAAAGSVVPRVSGRSIGFVLSSGNAELRRRSAQVIAGMYRALDLPASASNPEAVQLVTSEDSGEPGALEHALAELAGDGAVILVAGLDGQSAARAAGYADVTAIPVILLHFTKLGPDTHAFGLGVEPELEARTLDQELTQAGAQHIARVGAGGVACDVRVSAAGMPRFPAAEWKHDGVDALAVLGEGRCARDASREAAVVGRRPLLGLGFEAADSVDSLDPPGGTLALSAGHFPYRGTDDAPADQKKFVAQVGRNPSWYGSLGHDAAALAKQALAGFSYANVDDPRVVEKLHADAERRLSSAEATLWTSTRPGFSGGRVLERQLGAVSRKKGKP